MGNLEAVFFEIDCLWWFENVFEDDFDVGINEDFILGGTVESEYFMIVEHVEEIVHHELFILVKEMGFINFVWGSPKCVDFQIFGKNRF